MTLSVISRGPLASLDYLQVRPSAPLRPYVQCHWQARSRDASPPAQHEFMHPDGGMGLWFSFGAPVHIDGVMPSSHCSIGGPTLRTVRLVAGRGVALMGVRFHPGMGYPFLGGVIAELSGQTTPADAVPQLALEGLHERLQAAPSLAGRIALIEARLLAVLSRAPGAEGVLEAALAALRRAQGQARIAPWPTSCRWASDVSSGCSSGAWGYRPSNTPGCCASPAAGH